MSETNNLNNPATRLDAILQKARSVQHTLDVRTAWAMVFSISESNTEKGLVRVIQNLLALEKLFDETVFSLNQIPNVNESLFIEPIERLRNAMYWNSLTDTFSTYQNHLNDGDMRALKFAEHELFKYEQFNEKTISNDEIESILNDLDELYESIQTSQLPNDLRESLLELIEEMKQSIKEYFIRGAISLRKALTKSVGVIAVNYEEIEENIDKPEIQSLKNVIKRIYEANASAASGKKTFLLKAASSILPFMNKP